jgi:glycosyltransferase involved in cell wall biosynthesis
VSPRPSGRSSSAPDDRVRVLWLITGLGPGGAERLLVGAAPHVDRDRFDVSVCYLLPWKDHLVGDLEAAGVPVHCLDVRRVWNPSWVRRLRSFLDRGGHDVVHAHLPAAGLGARMAARRMGQGRPAVVYTEHNTWYRYRPVTRRLNARTFGWNDAAIAVSGAVAASIRARAPKVTVIPNGVDAEGIRRSGLSRAEARAALGLAEDALVVGTVGGITAKKGHVGLVRAARRVVDECPGTRFVFVGLAIDPDPVRAEIARLGLHDSVTLAGYRPDAASLMPAFDVYCLPSRFEGMPVSLLEAMAVGLPSVATAVGGVREVATSGEDAVVVPPADPEALAAALVDLARDPERRRAMGERARGTAERFSLEAMVRRTEAVYEAVLRRQSAWRAPGE